MFNLLPTEEKKYVRKIYLSRFAIVSLSLIIVGAIICGVALIPSYVILIQKEKAGVDRHTSILNVISAKDRDSLKSSVTKLKEKIEALSTKDTSVTELLDAVIAEKGSNVRLKGFSYQTLGTGAGEIKVEGVAGTRESLLIFSRRLESNPHFSKVDLPISNFASGKDISFVLHITVDNEAKKNQS